MTTANDFIGFGDQFDEELEDSKNVQFEGGNYRRQKDIPILGPEQATAKSGLFEFQFVDGKGATRTRRPAKVQGIILGSKFGRQQWATIEGKSKLLCATVEHSYRTRDGETKVVEGGLWEIPYGDALVNQRYNPTGSKQHEGKPLTCVQCHELGLNADCGSRGSIYFAIFSYENEDGDMVELPAPIITTLRAPVASAIAYQIYIKKELADRGYRPNQVITNISHEPTKNKLANMFKFEVEEPAETDKIKTAMSLLQDELAAWEAKREAERKEREAKRAANGNGGSSAKPAAKAPAKGKTAPAPEPEFDPDDDEPTF